MIGTSRRRRTLAALLAAPLVAALGACASADDNSSSGAAAAAPAASQASNEKTAPELRLGYFANVTHATPLVGIQEGLFAKALGDTKITTSIFNAGPAAVEAITGGSIDAAYLGPNPAINGYVKSNGTLLRIVAGATSGGAALVVKPGINSAADLKGKKLATPQLGGTQDVALRAWLAKNNL